MDFPDATEAKLSAGEFTDGDPATGLQASLDLASWGNNVTKEIIAVLTAASITPNRTVQTQLRDAINQLIADAVGGGSIAVLNEGGTPSIESGVASSRPAAGDPTVGALYISTDTLVIEQTNGSTWDLLFGITGTITADGFIKFATASGVILILQWMSMVITPNTTIVKSWPIAFPTAVFAPFVAAALVTSSQADLSVSSTLTQASVHNQRNPGPTGAWVLALGI